MYQISDSLIQHISTAKPKQRYEDNHSAINLLKSLQLSGDKTTKKQLDTLAKFNGWGSCHTVFNNNPEGWQKQAQQELKQLLGDKEFNSASESILNAHYTEPTIIKAMWDKIAGLGFTGGKVLEPSCGTGFFLGACPENIQSKSEFHAVELEKTSADIAKLLYPEARVYNQGFETVALPDGYFDLIIGNVPFGNYKCPDPRYDWLGLSIHNYFFAKCSDLVRQGGLVCLLTSPYTLDAPSSQEFRKWLGATQRLNLVSAIRLPAGVFKGVANTMVSPDILIFQKMPGIHSEELNFKEWQDTLKVQFHGYKWSETDKDVSEFNINRCFYSEFNSRSRDKYNIECVEKYKETRPESVRWYKDQIYSEPHKLLGTPGINQLYGQGFALNDDGRDVVASIATINVDCEYQPELIESHFLLIPPELQDTKDQSFVIWDGQVYQRDGYNLKPSKVSIAKLSAVHSLRDRLQQVIRAQSQLTDDQLSKLQTNLLDTYNKFVSAFGKINSKQNLSELACDPHYYLLRTLEKSDGKLADIFYKRVARQQAVILGKVESIEDAIIHSLNNKGSFDLSYVCEIMELDNSSVTQQLADKKLGFYNPSNEQWELKDKYLSGNVYVKLKQAEKAGLLDNVATLKAVQPTPMLPDAEEEIKLKCLEHLGIDWTELSEDEKKKLLFKTIKVQLGTSWINSKYYRQFAEEILNISIHSLKYLKPPVATWAVSHSSVDDKEYGTKHLNSGDLFTLGLNGVDPRIKVKDLEGKEHTDTKATEEARGKLEQIKTAFKQWIWQESDRCLDLCNYYNTNINIYTDREYDGSWLQLPSSNPDIKLNYWQLNGIARGLESNSTFYAWDVGTGKTFTLIATAMESKRLWLVNKPIICCLNGTEKQIYEDWIKLYPMANVLLPDKLDAEGRKLFTASLLTGDFDGAIITHSQFFMMKMGDEYVINFLENEKALLEDFLKDEGNNAQNESSKALKKAIKSVESRIAKIKNSGRKDDHINFEGICDFIAIDEIQMAKNLRVTTKMVNVRGINSNESQRALDTYMKLLYVSGNLENLTKSALSEQDNRVIDCIKDIGCSCTYEEIETKISEVIKGRVSPDALKANLLRLVERQALVLAGNTYKIREVSIAKGKIIGATGTILSNTMAEIFTWQRMFQLATLQDLNLEHFDSWASQFGEVVSGAEITPSQQYKVINRFKSFSNLSALHGLLSQFCDIVTFENVCGDLARPDGKFIDIVAPPSKAQLSFLRTALRRSEAISQRLVEPYEDNMLKVTTDLLKAALSMRLMGEAKESPESKIHECIWNVFKIYEATEAVKGVQLIFCDYSVPKNDRYHVYGYVKQMLVLLGIPENQIEFIHDHDKAKRKRLFEQVNSGNVRILLGSTEKLGTGCNVHKQGLWGIHHLDAPWTPKGMIQREGRIIRQGNGENLGQILKTGYVFRYITERLDALRWQTLQWKEEMIRKFLNGAVGLNEITDTDEASYSYNQVKSLATGNQLLVEEANLRNELNRLLIQQRSHQQTQFGLSGDIKRREKVIATNTDNIFHTQEDIKNSQDVLSETALKKLDKQWHDKIYSVIDNPYNGEACIGRYRGFTLYIKARAIDLEDDVELVARLVSDSGKIYQLPLAIPGKYGTIKFRRTMPLQDIDYLVSELPDILKTYQTRLEIEKKELKRSQSLVGKKFEQDVRILEIQYRLVEISKSMSQMAMAVDVGTESKGDTSDEECSQVETEDLSTTDTSIDSSIVEMLKQRDDIPQWLQQLVLEVDSYSVKTVEVASQEIVKTPQQVIKIGNKLVAIKPELHDQLLIEHDPVTGFTVVGKDGEKLREPKQPNGVQQVHKFKTKEPAEKFAQSIMKKIDKVATMENLPDTTQTLEPVTSEPTIDDRVREAIAHLQSLLATVTDVQMREAIVREVMAVV